MHAYINEADFTAALQNEILPYLLARRLKKTAGVEIGRDGLRECGGKFRFFDIGAHGVTSLSVFIISYFCPKVKQNAKKSRSTCKERTKKAIYV